MNDESLMPFGKYKGQKLANVPADYLLYIYNAGYTLSKDFKSYIEDNLDCLDKEKKEEDEQFERAKKNGTQWRVNFKYDKEGNKRD